MKTERILLVGGPGDGSHTEVLGGVNTIRYPARDERDRPMEYRVVRFAHGTELHTVAVAPNVSLFATLLAHYRPDVDEEPYAYVAADDPKRVDLMPVFLPWDNAKAAWLEQHTYDYPLYRGNRK